MLLFRTPPNALARAIQDRESAHYWSLLTPSVLRAFGCVSIMPDDAAMHPWRATSTLISPRLLDLREGDLNFPIIIEAPLSQTTAAQLGITVESVDVETFNLVSLNGAELGGVARQQAKVRNANGEPEPATATGDPWSPAPLRVFKTVPPGWTIKMRARLPGGELVPAIIVRGKTMVLAAPFFDIAGSWFAFPPLKKRFAGISSGLAPAEATRAIIGEIRKFHCAHASLPWIEALPFPANYKAALTVRHDYDRPIDTGSWGDLLRYYDQRDLKATVGILTYLMPRDQIDLIASHGHEIQLHCFAHDEKGFRDQLAHLNAALGKPLTGVTIHGGPAGVGFRGDTHYGFFEQAGVHYAEIFGVRDIATVPIARLTDGVPHESPQLVAPPFHFSLDVSTRPDDHRLDQLQSSVPRALASGQYVVLMNHPDIHREQLIALLNSINTTDVWCAPVEEVTRFRRTTTLASHARPNEMSIGIEFAEPLPQEAVFAVYRNGGKEALTAAKGTGSLSIPMPA